MAVSGLANSVYHPVDYAILNASVDQTRMGRAFSFHTFSGYLGAAVAPPLALWLSAWIGWQGAVVACGAAGCIVAGLIAWNSGLLHDANDAQEAAPGGARAGVRSLFTIPILMGLLFFAGLAMTHHGVGDFRISALNVLFDMSLAQAGLLISAFLFASPLGVLAGGWIADRTANHDLVNIVCLLVMGGAISAVPVVGASPIAIGLLLALAGFANGVLAPSRDMLIRAVTPPGQMGKVFGFVSTGFSIGGIFAPLLFGWLLDNSDPRLVFWVVGLLAALTMITVFTAGHEARRVA